MILWLDLFFYGCNKWAESNESRDRKLLNDLKIIGRMYKVVVMFDLMWKDTVLLIGTILMHRE